jgi:hypothetical protein
MSEALVGPVRNGEIEQLPQHNWTSLQLEIKARKPSSSQTAYRNWLCECQFYDPNMQPCESTDIKLSEHDFHLALFFICFPVSSRC